MVRMIVVMLSGLGLASVGCGKAKEGGGGGAEGGPPCQVAVKAYVDNLLDTKGNYLSSAEFTPNAEQVAIVSAKLVEHCTTTPWSADTKTCLTTTKDRFKFGKCFGDAMDSARVSQVIFDVVKGFKAAGSSR